MNEDKPYLKFLKLAFISNAVGIVLSFAFSGNTGVFGTFLIMLAVVLAIIGIYKKKQFEKNNNV